MKRLLLTSCICLFALGLFAQVQIEVIIEDQYDLQADLTDQYSEPIAHAWVVNTGTQGFKLRWLLEEPTDCPNVWEYKICDLNQCYGSDVTSNVATGGPNKPVVLSPGDSTIIDLHINPKLLAGCCSPIIHISDVTNSSNEVQLASLTFEVCISALSAVDEAHQHSLKVFPNPTTGQFSVIDNPLVKSVAVFNLLGKRVCDFEHQNGKLHDISGAPNGLYLVSLLDENGETIKTIRINKQDNRP